MSGPESARVVIATAWCPYCRAEVYLDGLETDDVAAIGLEEVAHPVAIAPLRYVARHFAGRGPWVGGETHSWNPSTYPPALLRARRAMRLTPVKDLPPVG